ncbi:MAG: HEAT repeat domain-containing protein [Planctomycetes bacterium]|nr:HEAT repeat domain-containing protein [Planctomycetota bacterium]
MNLAMLLLSLFALFPVAGDEDAALVAEFKKFYGNKDNTPTMRREAVLTVSGTNSLGAVQALTLALEDDEFIVRAAAVDALAATKNEAGARWLLDSVLLDRKASKNTRLVAGVAEAMGGMGQPFVLGPLLDLLEHRDLEVRLGAIAGLGRLKDAQACEHLVPLATDAEPSVAISALDALVSIGDAPAAQPAVLAALASENKSVRLKAISAVLSLRLKDGIRPLIMMLDNDPDPRVSEDAFEVLTTLTLRAFGDTTDEWLSWWDRTESAWKLPDLEKIAEAKKRIAETGGKYGKAKKTFQDIETKSDNILFVIDVSQSMSEPFGDPERLERSGRKYASLQRLEIVKEELINTIESLPDSTNFNVIAFATDVKAWKGKATKANILAKSAASDWVRKLTPQGGSGAAFRARMGLNSPTASDGQTNTYLALMTAFGEEVDKRRDSAFVTDPKDPIDTIFFLTDGEPTVGKTVDMGEIRAEVRRVNAFRGVQLHVIYVGAFGGKDFKGLAEENGGVFVSVGG